MGRPEDPTQEAGALDLTSSAYSLHCGSCFAIRFMKLVKPKPVTTMETVSSTVVGGFRKAGLYNEDSTAWCF